MLPVSWEFRSSVLALRPEGSYTNEELEGAVREAFADPRFGPGTRLLVDGRRSNRPISSADIEWRLAFYSSLPRLGLFPRVAFVLRPTQKMLVKLARAAISHPLVSREIEIEVFTNEAAATEWLWA